MFFNSSLGIIQKLHQKSNYRSEILGFLFIAFLVSGVFSFILYIIFKSKEKSLTDNSHTQKTSVKISHFFTFVAICGVTAYTNNVINLYLSGVVDSAIFFPIVNGIPLLFSVLVSFVLFKERLSLKQKIGLAVGLLAVIMIIV